MSFLLCRKSLKYASLCLISLCSFTINSEGLVDNGHYNTDLIDFIVVSDDEKEREWQRQQFSESGQEFLGRNVLQQLAIQYDISAETTGLMGEQIDLSSGSLSFLQVDIDIPGNFPIPVRLARSFGGPDRWFSANRFFGNWNLDLAYISTTMASADNIFFTGSWAQNKACTGSLNPQTQLAKGGAVLDVNDYWNADTVYIPGHGSTTLLTSAAATRSTKNNWKVSCFNSTHGYEGFRVTTPDGLTYLRYPHKWAS
ncbi:hypothetical protein [Alkalimonas sp.]|uniref:hypothetical protein n=1 Tax=Alkalimonas sp. TaxID=1872453 RepID=UPI00263ACACA|nr:hypothetical protein [Alkalimonas sp.]MCC5826324.1 hypothetical protein [Alkalimonas sp.]